MKLDTYIAIATRSGRRAKDTKLGREVAIQLLLEEFSTDPERLARLERRD